MPPETEVEAEAGTAPVRRRAIPWWRVARWTVLTGALSWSGLAWGLHRYGASRPAPEGHWDAIVVLGSRVFPPRTPGTAMTARVTRAAELFHEGRAELVVLTGGVGDAGVAESEVAAELAESLGVPRDAMVLERESTSTEGNARFAAEVIEGRRVLIVTDAYHVFRSERVFARYFDEVHGVGTVNPRWWPRIRGALREVIAIAGYGLQGRL